MRVRPSALLSALTLWALFGAAAAAAPAPPPATTKPAAAQPAAGPAAAVTAEQVKQLVERGEHRQALQAMISLLNRKPSVEPQYNRHEILLLKADCQLYINQTPAALQTLRQAQTEAKQAGSLEQAAAAAALSLLVQRSEGNTYRPKKGSDSTGIGILDRAGRARAFDALYEDELDRCELRKKQAGEDASVAPVLDIASTFVHLRALERLTKGGSRRTDQLSLEFSRWSAVLLDATLDRCQRQLRQIVDERRKAAAGRRGRQPQGARVVPSDRPLLDIEELCQKILTAVSDLNQGFGQPLVFKDVFAKAEKIQADAHRIRTAGK